MALIGVPNVSEGRDADVVDHLIAGVTLHGLRVLDVHSDPRHNRSVLTITGAPLELSDGLTELAERAASSIDLRRHTGVHPRLGALDVCPIVPFEQPMQDAVVVARRTAGSIARLGIPVYLYGAAALREAARELPDIRRGSLAPDLGGPEIDARTGTVCVGARGPLIAFNVNVAADSEAARTIAASVRESDGGTRGVRALGFSLDERTSQISMNLVEPTVCGIDAAFKEVKRAAEVLGLEITATEIVGLVEERFLPDPTREAARLLIEPGRSLESVLRV